MIKEKKEAHKSAQKRFTHFHSSAVLASSSTLRRSNSSAQTFRSPLKPSFHPPPILLTLPPTILKILPPPQSCTMYFTCRTKKKKPARGFNLYFRSKNPPPQREILRNSSIKFLKCSRKEITRDILVIFLCIP